MKRPNYFCLPSTPLLLPSSFYNLILLHLLSSLISFATSSILSHRTVSREKEAGGRQKVEREREREVDREREREALSEEEEALLRQQSLIPFPLPCVSSSSSSFPTFALKAISPFQGIFSTTAFTPLLRLYLPTYEYSMVYPGLEIKSLRSLVFRGF